MASAAVPSATFALAFLARPLGSAIFGHFGDRIGRKTTLVAALLTMGGSTVMIGLLPTYASIGMLAPILLALCRIGQGLGLGGEWGGAVLLATENAPPGKRAWYGMFPHLDARPCRLHPFRAESFLLLSKTLTNEQFLAFGWRLPFLVSSLLVMVGLYVRLKITETPVFQQALDKQERVAVPILTVVFRHTAALALGTMMALATFVLFYLLTVFCLSWGTSHLGYSREEFLGFQMLGIVFFALTIPFSASLADRHGRRLTLMLVTAGIVLFGLALGPLFTAGLSGAMATMVLGFSLMGLTYGPMGTVLSELFPTTVRYTGSSLSFNLAGILGASAAPSIATWLAVHRGLPAVGYYLSGAALLTFTALWLSRETCATPRSAPRALGCHRRRGRGGRGRRLFGQSLKLRRNRHQPGQHDGLKLLLHVRSLGRISLTDGRVEEIPEAGEFLLRIGVAVDLGKIALHLLRIERGGNKVVRLLLERGVSLAPRRGVSPARVAIFCTRIEKGLPLRGASAASTNFGEFHFLQDRLALGQGRLWSRRAATCGCPPGRDPTSVPLVLAQDEGLVGGLEFRQLPVPEFFADRHPFAVSGAGKREVEAFLRRRRKHSPEFRFAVGGGSRGGGSGGAGGRLAGTDRRRRSRRR